MEALTLEDFPPSRIYLRWKLSPHLGWSTVIGADSSGVETKKNYHSWEYLKEHCEYSTNRNIWKPCEKKRS